MNNYLKIINSGKTIFTKNDIEKILDFNTKSALDKFLYRSCKDGFLKKISYGIYSLKKYNIFELTSKIKKKSYISLETVLKKESVIFQYYETIFSISDNNLEKKIGDMNFKFFKIKDSVLFNQLGLINKGNFIIASKERAICDKIYLSKNYYFDNLESIDFEKLKEISQIYDNKRVILEVEKIIKNNKK